MNSKVLLFIIALTLLCLGTSNLQAQSFADNIVSKWSFEEAIVDDITSATGELLGDGGASYITGIKGKALDFSGAAANSIVVVEDASALSAINFTTESFTVSMWANVDPSFETEQTLLMKGSNSAGDVDLGNPNSNGHRYTIHTKNGEVRFAIDDDVTKSQLGVNVADIDGGYPLGEWVNIVGIRDRDEGALFLFVNGIMIGSMDDGTGDLNVAGQRLVFGNFHNFANISQGPIDEVLIINKALSDAEVMELYSSASSLFDNHTIQNISIAPNPVSNELIIRNATKLRKIEIYNLSGKMIRIISNKQSGTIRSNIEDMPSGHYIVKGYNDNNTVSTASFIKK